MRRDAEQRMVKFKDIVRDTPATQMPPWTVLTNLSIDAVKLVKKREDYEQDELRERSTSGRQENEVLKG